MQMYITMIVQEQIICNMIIPLIHIALIKIIYTNILDSSVTLHMYQTIHVLIIPMHSLWSIMSTSLHSLQEECFYGKLHTMQHYSITILMEYYTCMLILVINWLNYQGLIDWIAFYAVSAIFQPCNGGT